VATSVYVTSETSARSVAFPDPLTEAGSRRGESPLGHARFSSAPVQDAKSGKHYPPGLSPHRITPRPVRAGQGQVDSRYNLARFKAPEQ